MAIVKRKYNPGLVCSIFLNYPTGIWALCLMHKAGALDLSTNLLGFGVALIGHAAMIFYARTRYQRIMRSQHA